jgi:signal transduction histidine kinase
VSQRYLRASGNEEIGSVIRVAEEALERATALAWRLAGVEQRYRTRKPISVPNAIFKMSNILHRAVGEHVKLEIKADECLPYVQCDVADLENAVLNLVVNAREAMPSGGRLVIRIGASQADSQSPKTGVLISVSDNGCGMATATAEQAFDRSFSTKGAGACRGLGLSSVQKFVCELGGSVELKTLPGQGTSVILKMPAACSLMDGGVQ